MNKSVWIVSKGVYSDIENIGYFETKQEAKDYCDLINHGSNVNDWNRLWYSEVKHIDLVKDDYQVYYYVSMYGWGWEVLDCDRNCDKKQWIPTKFCSSYYERVKNGEVIPTFYFHIVCNEEEKAKKIARDRIAQIKEKYEECGNLEMAISCFNNN